MLVTIAAWFGFYEEGVTDAFPSARISLESPRSFWISQSGFRVITCVRKCLSVLSPGVGVVGI